MPAQSITHNKNFSLPQIPDQPVSYLPLLPLQPSSAQRYLCIHFFTETSPPSSRQCRVASCCGIPSAAVLGWGSARLPRLWLPCGVTLLWLLPGGGGAATSSDVPQVPVARMCPGK